jgi:hypothetical protein
VFGGSGIFTCRPLFSNWILKSQRLRCSEINLKSQSMNQAAMHPIHHIASQQRRCRCTADIRFGLISLNPGAAAAQSMPIATPPRVQPARAVSGARKPKLLFYGVGAFAGAVKTASAAMNAAAALFVVVMVSLT